MALWNGMINMETVVTGQLLTLELNMLILPR